MTTRARPDEFSVTVAPNGWVAFVEAHGELDVGTTPVLERALEEVDGYDTLMLDLRDLSFVSSSGVHLVLRACQRAAARGGGLRIMAGRPEVQRVFEVTGVQERLRAYLDRPGAASSPRREGHFSTRRSAGSRAQPSTLGGPPSWGADSSTSISAA